MLYNIVLVSAKHLHESAIGIHMSPPSQDYAEELFKKELHDPDNHDGVITHLEPDILECEVKWALGASLQTKLVEVIEFQLSYFKS